VLTARRADRLETLARGIRDSHRVDVRVMPADLADPGVPGRLRDDLVREGAAVDVLVNNAGYGLGGRAFTAIDWKEQSDFLEVLLRAPVHLCHAFVPGMVERGWGRVLNVASVAAYVPERPGEMYGPAKAFLVRFTRALALDLAGTGVTATAVCPGYTHSEFHDVAGTRERVRGTPKWLWMTAEAVARESVDAMLQGRVVHVNGWINRWFVRTRGILPAGLIYLLAPKRLLAKRRKA
jgi:short-subunit dehydrogenase